MMRLPDWPARLSAVIEAARGRPFAYGEHDCCTFAAACVQAVTGEDFFAMFDRTYSDARGAVRAIRANGGLNFIVDSLIGERVKVAFAARGDVVLVQFEGRDTVAICNGRDYVCPGRNDLVFRPMSEALLAWRV